MKHFCREVSQLVSDGYDRELSLPERMRVRLHLWMCRPCNNYSGNLALLERLFDGIRQRADDHAPCLSDKDRQRILEALRQSESGLS